MKPSHNEKEKLIVTVHSSCVDREGDIYGLQNYEKMRCVWRIERSVKWSSFRGKFYLYVHINHHQFDGVLAHVKEDISRLFFF